MLDLIFLLYSGHINVEGKEENMGRDKIIEQ